MSVICWSGLPQGRVVLGPQSCSPSNNSSPSWGPVFITDLLCNSETFCVYFIQQPTERDPVLLLLFSQTLKTVVDKEQENQEEEEVFS